MTSTVRTTSTRAATLLVLLASAYVALQMIADISSLKLTEVAGFAVDGGTLVYPLTFTVRDLVHKAAGAKVARVLIVAAAAVNLFMAGVFWVVAEFPLLADSGPQSELFGDVLGPVWRIVFASILAEVVAELIDTEVYRGWVQRFGGRHQWGRVLSSNMVAIPVDSAIFVIIAFTGVVPASAVWEIFWVNVVVKGAVAVASVPLIYTVRVDRVVDDPGG